MTRAATKIHLDDANTDLASALADVSCGDPIHKAIKALIQRLNYLITRATD